MNITKPPIKQLLNILLDFFIVMLIVYISVLINLKIQMIFPSLANSIFFNILKILIGSLIFSCSGFFLFKKYQLTINPLFFNKELGIKKNILLIFISILIGIAAHLLRSFISDLIHYYGINYGWRHTALTTQNFFTGMIFIWIIHASAEEYFFRGFLFNKFKNIFPIWFSIIISCLLFSIVHIPYSIPHAFFLFLTSFVITISYEYFGSLIFPICVHAITNIYSQYVTINGPKLYQSIKIFLTRLNF
jgi:membrane protease YdiL (CAAX protease family)